MCHQLHCLQRTPSNAKVLDIILRSLPPQSVFASNISVNTLNIGCRQEVDNGVEKRRCRGENVSEENNPSMCRVAVEYDPQDTLVEDLVPG